MARSQPMFKSFVKTAAAVLVVSAGMMLTQPKAWAQSLGNDVPNPAATRLEPPALNFKSSDEGVEFLTILGMLGCAVLVICANFVPTKRGHQD
ncbi:MAG: hypothetical protein IBJ18_09235 [Phycisphaerales bacterium]|nr:hypothetical protein [Phycisphaerales bacterium]